MDLKDFIIPCNLINTDNRYIEGNIGFNTSDLIFLETQNAYNQTDDSRRVVETEWAGINGGYDDIIRMYWMRPARSRHDVYAVGFDGKINSGALVDSTRIAICPGLRLNLEAVLSAKAESLNNFKINEVKGYDDNYYYTIEFGEYPKSYVGKKENDLMEEKFRTLESSVQFIPTRKKYTAHINDDGSFTYYDEYKYHGEKFVHAQVCRDGDGYYLWDGTEAEKGDWVWFKVEPITWKIHNWEDMPTEINPNGSGKATYIDVRAENAIASGIPYYPNLKDKNCSMWQNSTIRGYLNGINVNNITSNGNTQFTAPNGGDFTEHNFLTEALTLSPTPIATQQSEDVFHSVVDRLKRKGYGVKVQETPMSVKDQIRFYIDNGKSFMLHGPSGIGKTRRIEEADPDFVSIVLRNGILPEEVIGKTIYPNNDKTQAGTWVPPAWYASLCEKCEQEPDKQHVLFIDEITNVKPSEQSLVFHLVLNNSIGPNIGPLPENVVVVAAGNSKEESDAAYNMPEPLFRRFDGHIELKPDIQLWLEWGSEPSIEDESRPKVHPLVANFVGTYGNQVFYSPYDSEEPPKFAIDPRGWEQVSDIIYDNNGLIARELIENKVGRDITTSFIAFAKTPPLMLEDILENNYDHNDIPAQFDAKYALALSLRNANLEQIGQVREFIARELGAEILAMFDVAWVGNDNEKAIYLAGLPKLQITPETSTPSVEQSSFDPATKLMESFLEHRKQPIPEHYIKE